jgi:hypothetical protein
MNLQRMLRAAVLASLVAAPVALAQPSTEFARLSTQYAAWAGGRANAESLVRGLSSGGSVTLVTSVGADVSLAGFRPASPLSYGEVSSALSNARQSLSRLGIAQPTAEQIQAALIGGDIERADGSTRRLSGVGASSVPGALR